MNSTGHNSLRNREESILKLCTVFGVFLVIFSAMLLVISSFGSVVPFLDEWDAEAIGLYKPFLEGRLTLSHFIEPHNGHRIVLSRITELVVYLLNGGWDPQLQMVFNAAIHALIGAFLSYFACQELKGLTRYFAIFATCVLFSIPYSWLSILVAFQSQFYFMMLFSVLALLYFSQERYRFAYFFAILSMLSMTSGALVLPAVIISTALDSIQARAMSRSQLFSVITCSILFLFFLFFLEQDGASQAFQAQSVSAFVITVIAAISWPFRISYGVGLLVYVPFLILMVRELSGFRSNPFYRYCGAFLLLQIIVMGYFRGGYGEAPANRYWEILIVGLWLNTMCLAVHLKSTKSFLSRTSAYTWIVLMITGLVMLAVTSLENLPLHKSNSELSQTLISDYIANGDSSVFQGRSQLELSYPYPDRLAEILTDPSVRQILPSALSGNSQDNLGPLKELMFRLWWLLGGIGLTSLIWSIAKDYKLGKSLNAGIDEQSSD